MILTAIVLGAVTYIAKTVYDMRDENVDEEQRAAAAARKRRSQAEAAAAGDGNSPFKEFVDQVNDTLNATYTKGASVVKRSLGLTDENRRREQLAALTGDDSEIVASPEERDMQRRIVLATGMLVSYGAAPLYPPLMLVTFSGLTYQATRLTIDAIKDIQETNNVGWDSLGAVWMVSAVVTGHLQIAVVLIFPVYLARLWLFKTRDVSLRTVNNILGEEPRSVWMVVGDVEVEVPFEKLQVDDRIVIYAGEHFPIDGRVVTGQGDVDQHILTGEVKPVLKELGDEVYAGTLLLTGKLIIAVTALRSDSAASSIGAAIANTLDYRDVSELRAKSMTDRVALPALGIGGVTWALMGANSGVAAITMLPGYHLPWTGPLNVMNHLDLYVDRGILIKDGRALERLAKVDTVVFDKTGTLTHATPQVHEVHCVGPYSESEILGLAAAIEAKQSHPLAVAIREAALERGLPQPEIAEVELVPGFGLQAVERGRDICVGSARFMVQRHVPLSTQTQGIFEQTLQRGHLAVFVSINGQVAGLIELYATVRAEAVEVVHALQRRGLELFIMSGDHEEPTRQLAQALGVDGYFSAVLPEGKAALIEQMQREGRFVCFVGDGINDSVALKKSQISVSLRGATTIAVDVAQIILREDDLKALVPLFELGESYEATMDRNVLASTIPGVANIAFIYLFHTGITVSAALFLASSAISGVNTMLPKFRQPPELETSTQALTASG